MNADEWKESARWIVSRAALAPSSHNTQPWRFRLSDPAIELRADRARALPVNDPQDRELVISCGCALMNVRVAAASLGWRVEVRLLPDPRDRDLLARVSFNGRSDARTQDGRLVDLIEARRTYRRRFAPRKPDATALDDLGDAANAEGARLVQLATAEVRREIAGLVAEGDAALWASPSWRRELAAWMRARKRGDGLTVPDLAVPWARLVVRAFDLGGSVAARDRRLVEASPSLAILATEDDHVVDWLRAGQALQRALLVACKHGLQASYLNQPVQVAALRTRLRRLAGAGFPQILLRLGYPAVAVAPAPRRGLDDVIV